MGAWSRTGPEATIIVSFPRAKALLSFELEHNSIVSWHSCSPAYNKACNFGYVWCTASGSPIKPEGPGVQAICALYALADHGLCEFIFWKHLFFVLVNKTINDDHGDCDTRRDTIGG